MHFFVILIYLHILVLLNFCEWWDRRLVFIHFYRGMLRPQTMTAYVGAERNGGGSVDIFPEFISGLSSRNIWVAACASNIQ